MPKTEVSVLFKKMQKDDKKEVLQFEIKGDNAKSDLLHGLAGSIIFFSIQGCEAGDVQAEFAKIQKDSKKTTLEFKIKGDSEEKALKLYKHAGQNVTMTIEPSQTSLEDFYKDENMKPIEDEEDPHKGIEYAVDLGGTVDVKDKVDVTEEDMDETASFEEKNDELD